MELATKSLLYRSHEFATPSVQLSRITSSKFEEKVLPSFSEKLKEGGISSLTASSIDTLQVNIGKMCNQTCKHCHVDAGPDRKEIMTQPTMQQCIDVVKKNGIPIVDITGGAPEMNPNFRWFIEELSRLDKKIIVRCNLTILLANPKYSDLPSFYKKHKVEIVSSLPYFSARKTDAQRGKGVFDVSIAALRMLNEVGYGSPETGLLLHLVYNPSGAFLPAAQHELEMEYKQKLKQEHGIVFNNLFSITNLPISRFLEYLVESDNLESYMEKLVFAFNPVAAHGVMCRTMISVGWDGRLYDCDFNQMLDLKVNSSFNHISNFSRQALIEREIVVNQHCYGCTAGSGSSCGGEVVG